MGRDPAVFCSIDQAKAKKKSIIMALTRSDGARQVACLETYLRLCISEVCAHGNEIYGVGGLLMVCPRNQFIYLNRWLAAGTDSR